MKIYFAHSREFNYQKDLYDPIRADRKIPQAEVILPHEYSDHSNNTRDFYRTLDVMIAEVSYSSIGLGIELGWAADDGIPIYCLYRQGSKPSGSLHAVTHEFYEYSSTEEMLEVIGEIISKL